MLAFASVLPLDAWAFSARSLIRPTGESASDFFGYSVSGAGDVNGDGYADMIVGAYGNDAGGSNAGRAYVYYGGPGADVVSDLTLTGAAGDAFGRSVSGAGDVNGDGYDDLIVGAHLFAGGRAYVYYGGPGADTVADLTLNGAAVSDFFGISVSGAGDVNGDGHGDIIVGAPQNDAGGANAGRAYVYYGGPGADAVADLTLTGVTAGDNFGYSVSGGVDVSGDGYGDVIVGAYLSDGGGTDAGRAFVFYGGPGANAVADLTMTGGAAGDFFGISVSILRDVNGDGHGDVVVGAYGDNGGGSDAGRAYVYYGGPAADGIADLTLTGAAVSDFFGISVSGAGDVNRDGYGDVIVGAYQNDAGGLEAGRGYVYYGGPDPDAVADVTLTGEAASDFFGVSVSGAGDVNGDGYDDVIVGAYGNDAGGGSAGRAYVYTSRPYEVLSPNGGEQWIIGREHMARWLGADPADLWISFDGGANYSLLASEVGGAEQNEIRLTAPSPETGVAKIRVSASGEPVTHSSMDASDSVFTILSAYVPPAAAHRLKLTPTGQAMFDFFGFSASGAGDVNGDGYGDLIVGAIYNDTGGTDAGRAYVYYGGPGADAVADLTLTGAAADDNFGYSVSGAGDVNGDGYGDVIVGLPGPGRAYVYYGGPTADAVADLTLTGETPFDFFGRSVSGAGDVNGDGHGDVIVGADASDAGGQDAGRAYVYYGGLGADAVADLTLTGAAALDGFGYTVSGAGDVNGDSYDDLIVGAYGSDDGGTFAGQAYVYYGGPGADAVADLTMRGTVGDNFGRSVSEAGDMNGDGYSDVIVGGVRIDGTDAGRADVYYGGPAADGIADLTLTGAAVGDFFGISVSGAGDVNGDGFSDVIVGAYQNDAGGTDAGRAYVYYGGPGADALPDIMLTGAAAIDFFGNSVSAEDINGDGFSDLIVAAIANDAGGESAGRVYLYACNRYFVTVPNGGETWNVGATKTISWLGAEPADVWLSKDGGEAYSLLKAGMGGKPSNSIAIQVPHAPTKFAKIKVTPTDAATGGSDESDSLFTIQTSVSLLSMLAAPLPEGGVSIAWQTDPGPEDLAGYRLEKAQGHAGTGSGVDWRTIVPLTRETHYTDPSGGPGSRYRLFVVNGLGQELWLGEAPIRPRVPLSAWPLPYRGGSLAISFATSGGLGGVPANADVALYGVSGRLVRTITRGSYAAGYQSTVWDGRDDRGGRVAAGIYFLRSRSGGEERTLRVAVLR